MPLRVVCPSCAQQYQVSETAAGRKLRCKKCDTAISVPGAAAEGSAAMPRGLPPARRPKTTPAKKSKDRGAQQNWWKTLRSLRLYIAGGVVILALIAKFMERRQEVPAAVGVPEPVDVSAVPFPEFPELGTGHPVGRNGVTMHTVSLKPRPGETPFPGSNMSLRIYLPPGTPDRGSLACVLVPPAGSILITGNNIDAASYHDETLPYAEAGAVAITFSLDGPIDIERATVQQVLEGYQQFRAAAAGMVNVRNALEFALRRLPEVDQARVIVAGHSSAGTLALLAAAQEPRLAACVAYAPEVDVEQHVREMLRELADLRRFPGLNEFARETSPQTVAAQITPPVFLFHARDDSNTSFQKTEAFAAKLTELGKPVTLLGVETGEHYDSMIQQGIPAAIDWLRQQGLL